MMMLQKKSTASTRAVKTALLTSAAGLCLLGSAAHAQSGPEMAQDVAHAGGANLGVEFIHNTPQAASIEGVQDQPQIVITGPGQGETPTTIRDTAVDVTGVGMFYRADGFVCTGTLINPRTVIFAAHCVNDVETENWGSATGGIPAAFSFRSNALPGFQNWFANNFETNTDVDVYNVNQIVFHPDSLETGFLEADVAIASLDTPAANIPTWALLFSALPAPESISLTSGTGYHVKLNGYGGTGYGENGDTLGVDFRRRAAENFIGILGSLDDRNEFLFGSGDGLEQNLYQLDFDSPDHSDAHDFNLFRDDALPREATTAGGDSGGPLILDQTFDEELVIGVLSGGSRFFGAQPFSSYGTSSFYQPLYLFWDWIVENNPYRYATNVAGDGNWSDPDHWVLALDPNYRILTPEGALANGVPTNPGAGASGDDDTTDFGQICYQSGSVNECYDLATRTYYVNDTPVPGSEPEPQGEGTVRTQVVSRFADTLAAENEGHGTRTSITGVEDIAYAAGDVTNMALPPATFANGLPGGSGFVPDNRGYDPEEGINARYFDVTLAAAGTTTLDTDVEIDQLTIAGAETTLDITAGGELVSLMGISHATGIVNVDGTIGTYGDYTLFNGLLTGSGNIVAPYFTSIMGGIAPGTMGTTGTLNLYGNAILASASTLLIDVGANGVSDLFAVHAVDEEEDYGTIEAEGMASIGGTLAIAPVSGYLVRDGDTYTVLTAEGGISGTFDEALSISAILTPQVSYTANSVLVEIEAGSYADVIDSSSPVQSAYAQLLNQNRTQYGEYSELYGTLDVQNAETIRTTLQGFAPQAQTLTGFAGVAAVNVLTQFNSERIAGLDPSSSGGSLTMIGRPIEMAALSARGFGATDIRSDANQDIVQENVLPDNVSVFVAGGYIDGDSAGMAGVSAERNQFDGWFAAAGVEARLDDTSMIGFSVSYADIDGSVGGAPQTSEGQLYQGSLYGKVMMESGLTFDAQISAGAFDTRSIRNVAVPGGGYTLRAEDTAFVFTSEVGIGKSFDLGALSVGPRASIRASEIQFTPTAETGGGPALQYDLGTFESLQARAGAMLQGKTGMIRPYLSANYVHDFEERPAAFGANFVGGVGPNAIFALAGTDQDWAEIAGGVTVSTGNVDLSVSAQTTIEREDVEAQNYRGSVTFRF
ncbi:autotransporter domain-containing protein [Sphingosinithalassobacter sp. CS137]|uniref:autotransporter domain-containing protein n=1 Tax=Sphingosinithalassobacter sp. CS137 TaxID=2762748 RepID=UPI0021CEC102|nr:autotransporter domain-containing protein [Sphingosinithalassobacter sp. CS137]